MPNTLATTYIVNGNIYTAGTERDKVQEADRELLDQKQAFGPVELPEHGTVSLDDQEREELERRGVVERPPRHMPGTFLAGNADQGDSTEGDQAPDPNAEGDTDGLKAPRGRGR